MTVPLREVLAAPTAAQVWLRADAGATAVINGVNVAVPAGLTYAPFAATLNGGSVTFGAGAATYWVALIETLAPVPAGPQAALHWAGGEYQVGGIIAHTPGSAWPGLAGPAGAALQAASATAAGTRVVAYLELSERHITAVEDPGIREQALGGDHATATRSEVLAQVKLATAPAAATPAQIAGWFAAPALPGGTVTLGTATAVVAADPCDLPVPGGYTGPDNRLYRLAVHSVTVGAGAETVFTWSRDNAADLFPVSLQPDAPPGSNVNILRLRSDLPLRAGDLVELLSEATDLGDTAPATVGPGGLVRPRRAQGRLFRLEGGEVVSGSTRDFALHDPLTGLPVAPFAPAPFGTAGVKVRRWSGMIRRPGVGPLVAPLEHGITATIAGAFEPGDWWQYEARALASNANGPVQTAPHGPERLFAPLALMEQAAAGQPMRLIAWLDDRYNRLCQMHADSVAYDGDRSGTDADTVQEALDELYLRVSDGCGEIAVPVGASIQDVIDAIPAGGSARICLNAGLRTLTAPVTVAGKGDLIVGGIGPGTILRRAGRLILTFRNCRSVDLRDFAVEAQQGGGGAVIDIVDCGEVRLNGLLLTAAGPCPHGAVALRIRNPAQTGRIVSVRGCQLRVGQGDSGILALDPGHAAVEDNTVEVPALPHNLVAALASDDVASAMGTLLLDRAHFYAGDGGFDFVGSPVMDITVPGPFVQTRRAVVMAGGVWGQSTLSFTTQALLGAADWDLIAEANPAQAPAAPVGMEIFLRRFRKAMARQMFGAAGGGVVVPAAVNGRLAELAALVAATNTTAHGSAGITIAMTRGPIRSLERVEPVSALFADASGQTARVACNRIAGFAQGVHVGASGGGTRTSYRFARRVEVADNHIRLRVPAQARQRHGIMVGNALSVRVTGNLIHDLHYRAVADGAAPMVTDLDGIRLSGWFGPMLEASGNTLHGPTIGVRLTALGTPEPSWGRPDVFVRRITDNAYSGDGIPQLP